MPGEEVLDAGTSPACTCTEHGLLEACGACACSDSTSEAQLLLTQSLLPPPWFHLQQEARVARAGGRRALWC